VGFRPQLNVRCARCGRRREGLRHVCVSNSARRATIRISPAFGSCPRCGKEYGGRNGNLLTHTCRPDSDFKQRKARYNRKVRTSAERDRLKRKADAVRARERARSAAQIARLKARYEDRLAAAKAKATEPAKASPPRPRRPAHDYLTCTDAECLRPVCVAFREGQQIGREQGFEQGYAQGWDKGYARGFPDGRESCPGPHNG